MVLKVNDNIELVPISMDFVHEIHESFTDEIIQFLPIDTLSNKIEDTLAFVKHSMEQREAGTDLVWAITYEKQFAGCCGIHTIQSKTPHFGIWVKKEQQGKGIGKKVVTHVLRWGISNLDVDYIKYPVDQRNTVSIGLIAGLGLELADHYQLGDQKKLEVDEYRIYKY